MAFADKLGIDQDAAFSLAAGFGGGIASIGDVCGAVTGATMVLGVIYGQPGDDPDESKEETARKVNEFLAEFKTRQGSITCRELIDGIDLLKPEGRQEWADKNMHERTCLPAVQTAVKIIEEMGM